MTLKNLLSNLWIEKLNLFFAGLIACLSFAPLHFLPGAILGFSWFFYVIANTENAKVAFWQGWLFGAGFNIGSLYWIGHSFTTVGMWYFSPLGSILLPSALAFFQAIVAILTVKFSRHKLARLFLFCLLWSILEWVKGWIFTGFPWNLVGYIWNVEVLQLTAYIGIYGLSAFTVLLLVSVGTLNIRLIGLSVLSFTLIWLGGLYRLDKNPTEHTGINMRVVQASIPQNTKWVKETFEDNLNKWIALSNLEADRPLKAIIWCEASVPTFVEDYIAIREKLAEAVPPNGILITGAPRKIKDKDKVRYFTSTIILDGKAAILAAYNKTHLVPFGEYMPFSSWLPLQKLTVGTDNYSVGTGLKTIEIEGIPSFSPLICYEAIFSGNVTADDKRPEWLLNQTNDAWFGESVGPHQHLNIARTRAIEEGLPLVRSANNGISAVIDPMGRILYRIELNEVGFIDFDLPKILSNPTIFSQYKNLGFWLILAFYGMFFLIFNRKQRL